jgi:hypothetical protein
MVVWLLISEAGGLGKVMMGLIWESVSGRDSNHELLSTSLKNYHLNFVSGNDLA